MITTFLIHAAIWTHFAVVHAAGVTFDLRATLKPDNLRQARNDGWRWRDETPAPPAEKVVIRETTLSEKLELDIDSIARPNKEIASVQEEANRLMSSIDIIANAKGPSWETPNLRQDSCYVDWNKMFVVDLDVLEFDYRGQRAIRDEYGYRLVETNCIWGWR